MYEPGEEISLHPVPDFDEYGIKWPKIEGISQLTRELKCISIARDGAKTGQVKSVFYHMINVIRILWGKEHVELFREANAAITVTNKNEIIWNTYFLNVIKFLCEGESCMLTGPASAAKTFATAVYCLCSYYAAPKLSMCMISTTSGTASEGRIWGDVKSLHKSARFDANGISSAGMGKVIDYLKAITFDINEGMVNDASWRDLRNGIQVIPIPKDSKGDQALNSIMGRKNKFVYWVIDELPAMMRGALRPRRNLEANPFCQVVGIGNANMRTDPHGEACEPKHGWSDPSVTSKGSKVWYGKTYKVMFLDGLDSPNDDPRLDQSKILNKLTMPFPYLSNRISRDTIAEDAGNGDMEFGRNTIDFLRFAIGFWLVSSFENTVITDEFIDNNSASEPPLAYNASGFHTYAALDPGWTSGGDCNSVNFIKVGFTTSGNPQIEVNNESFVISPLADEREEYRKLVAKEFVRILKSRGVEIRDAGIDINGDGGLMYKAIIEEWGQSGLIAISSLEPASESKYDNIVTQYWFAVRDLIASGNVRGFNKMSKYAIDLKSRFFYSTGKGKVAVEKKKDMKKRIRRSPDNGDSFAYCAWIVLKKWQYAKGRSSRSEKNVKPFDPYNFQSSSDGEEFALSHTYDDQLSFT